MPDEVREAIGWKAPTRQPPSPRAPEASSPSQSQSEGPSQRSSGESSSQTMRSSSRGSSEPERPPVEVVDDGPRGSEALEALVAHGLFIASSLVNWAGRRRGMARTDLRMSEQEAERLARPIARIVSRRFHVRGLSGDAVDAGAGAGAFSTYFFRVLGIEGSATVEAPSAPRSAPSLEEEERARIAWEEAEAERRARAAARPEPEVEAEPAAEDGAVLGVFDGMEDAGIA